MQIVGVSYADLTTLVDWAADEAFRYELWQDTDRALSVHFGAASSTSAWMPDRRSVVLDGDGNHILTYDVTLYSIGSHPSDVLEDCQKIWGAR